MPYEVVFLSLFILDSFINIYSTKNNVKLLKNLTKLLLMPLLLCFYVSSASVPNSLIVCALIFAFLGDALLIGRGVHLGVGALFFLIGHIFYIMLFLNSIVLFQLPIWLDILVVPYLFYGIRIAKAVTIEKKTVRYPAYIYIITILVMSFSSFINFWHLSTYQALLPFIGSLLFVTSDSMLGLNAFGAKKRYEDWIIMLTYIAAQFCIVLGFI